MKNINTVDYWNTRFSSGDWENKKGRLQTFRFAQEQAGRLGLTSTFSGVLLDFGCGLGDAMPVYKKTFPMAKLIGVDHSPIAITKCREKYSNLAEFICCEGNEVPIVDVIVASNVFEHLSNDVLIARELIKKCKKLFIIVPYQEVLSGGSHEHINSYDENSYSELTCLRTASYVSYGLGQKCFMDLVYNVWVKNIFRFFFHGKIWRYKPVKEILFEIKGEK